METSKTLNVSSVIEHKQPGLPRFVCIPMTKVAPWKLDGTTTVEGSLNAVEIGRRSFKRWDDRKCWFMELPEPLCRKANVTTGETVKLSLRLASAELPAELSELIANDREAKQRWERLTPGQQRMLREEVFAASQSATRTRRARRALGL